MFCIHIMTDVIKIPACDLLYHQMMMMIQTTSTTASVNTTNKRKKKQQKRSLLPMIHREIDRLYPNRVLINVGLVIGRYYHHEDLNSITTHTDAVTTIKETHKSNQNQNQINGCTGTASLTTTLNGNRKGRKRGLLETDTTTATKNHHKQRTSTMNKKQQLDNLLRQGTQILYDNNNRSSTNNTNTNSSRSSSSSSSNCGTCVGSSVHYHVQCPMIVFRPFIGEILIGTIHDMNSNGILVSLGNFFSAIYIPSYNLLHPSVYSTESSSSSTESGGGGIWVWTPSYDDDDNDNTDDNNVKDTEVLRYEMHIGDEIRIRVQAIHYTKNASPRITTAFNSSNNSNNNTITMVKGKPSPINNTTTTNPTATSSFPTSMYIVASICEDGLGLTSWWTNEDEEEEDNENDNNNEEYIDDENNNLEEEEEVVEEEYDETGEQEEYEEEVVEE